MRNIHVKDITEAVKSLCMDANYNLPEDVLQAFNSGLEIEESPVGRSVLNALKENARIAGNEKIPICQDTGFSVFFMDVGQEVHIEGGSITDAINEGVRQGYKEGYLRKSICDAFTRKNTGDNTPAVINYDIVPGDKIKIICAPKGGGSSNMSRVIMLKPADGIEGIKNFVIQRVLESGSNPCPPVIVGVGIGGSMEKVALLATKALLRPLGTINPDPVLREIEEDLLKKINDLGMGPEGFGGRFYAMAVHIEKFPCHIASLPVAVNISCHASRHKEIVL
ncbi:MAG: fumarate hydratase [Nitrospinae bacterium RIFCSPLOWO2_02_FULL_39_110]|nr:MAG: fumarate hydratase [Nitrospinae bacterium RIFCSPHIGHO2_12_FULL_39_42]OGV99733.1 MAG: fumarate hydratase [Nitrospinae bacterium RIFCSPHIGHO2_02_FULL_39_82]OGW05424.1 MAG: fumarate hydratase [Nitrospinae bacterium RIFCSPLOWO2_02_39_17]OGW07365.1 MAG: fumarate hydratase [Nitrospinae bacterium RIFCSPLOWO2_02_FULL_39_110]OGW09748.1 MAG: fumarate hydratase [Nitrospinae bacterium RIFCSPLOWO2_12_39_15]HLA48566.1 fumarate hydratase [Nitrospinota bacterium]